MKRISRLRSLFFLGTATFCLLAPPIATPIQANVLGDLSHSISSLWGQKKQKQSAARTARTQATALNDDVEFAHDRLAKIQRLLQGATDNYQNLWRQMRRTEANLVKTRHRVQIVQARYEDHQRQFGARLASMQRYGQPSYLQIFLGSESLSDLVRRTAYFQALAQRDAQLQSQIKADRLELQRAQNSLMAQWNKRNQLQKQANCERERIVQGEQAQRAAWREINNSRSQRLAFANAQIEASHEIGTMLGQLETKRGQIIAAYEAQAARERAQRRAQIRRQVRFAKRYNRPRSARYARRVRLASYYTPQLAPMPIEALGGHADHDHGDESRTGWQMPVKGRMSSRFGNRYHPILRRRKLHTGQDIAARTGTPIKAASSGRVLYSGWQKAYGNTVIIDNGKGVTTVYGHASKLGVKAGQPIKKGEYIGNVGSTGWSTGSHLHFEVRKNGKPVNPKGYVR